MLKKTIIFALLLVFTMRTAFCADLSNPLGIGRDLLGNPTEYVYRHDPEDILMPIYVWGAVLKPGIYQVPLNTDLVTLLSLAGGPSTDADLNAVTIKHRQTTRSPASTYNLNLYSLVNNNSVPVPMMLNSDIVVVKKKENWISTDTLSVVTIVTAVVSIAVMGIVIKQSLK